MMFPRLYSIQAKFSILLIIMVGIILGGQIFSVLLSNRFLATTKFFVHGTLPKIQMARTLEKAVYQLGGFSHGLVHRHLHENLQGHYSALRATLDEVERLTVILSQEGGLVDILSLNLVSQAIRSHAAVVFQIQLNIRQNQVAMLDAQANLNLLVHELDELSARLEQLSATYVENVFEQYKLNSGEVISEIEGAIRVKLLLGVLSIAVLYLLYYIIVTRGFAGRLSMISKAMSEDSMEKGGRAIPLNGNDEITAMARSALALLDKAQRLRELATIDELTQTYNRRRFFELADKEAKRASRTEQGAVFLMIDLDHFKQINDTYGHDFGDRVLYETARVCKQTIREIDVFARYGGEEFVLLMPETSLVQGQVAAQRLLATVASLDFSKDGAGSVYITASIGLAEAQLGEVSVDTALKNADIALYRAKELGRNRIEIFEEGHSGNSIHGFR